MRAFKAFHNIVASYLYRMVQLHWLASKGGKWKNGWHAGYEKIGLKKPRDKIKPIYSPHIRHLVVFDHTHTQPLQRDIQTTLLHVDLLEIATDYRQYISEYNRWCDGCRPGVPGEARPDLSACNILALFTCKIAILSPLSLFSLYQSSGLLKIARAPASTFSRTERVIIKPASCFLRTTSPGFHLCIGAVPDSVKRIDIVFEPHCHLFTRYASKNILAYDHQTVKQLQDSLIIEIADLLFNPPDHVIPPSCSIHIVGLGSLVQVVNPGAMEDQHCEPMTISELESAAKVTVREEILRDYGDSHETREKLGRLHFVDLKQYAKKLRGDELNVISDFTWAHWEEEEQKEREKIAKAEEREAYEKRLEKALRLTP